MPDIAPAADTLQSQIRGGMDFGLKGKVAMVAGASGVAPADPWVSTSISTPARSAAASRASAAM